MLEQCAASKFDIIYGRIVGSPHCILRSVRFLKTPDYYASILFLRPSTGPLHVFHSCFQYCETDLQIHHLTRCAHSYMDTKHIGVACNHAVFLDHGDGEMTGPETTGLMRRPGVFLLAGIVVLMVCLGSQCVRKRMQSRLGMF